MKTSRRLLVGSATLSILLLAMGLAFASDSAPATEPEQSPFFEATLQQAVDELDGKVGATNVGQSRAATQPNQSYTSDASLWPECEEPGYTWDVLAFPKCHYTSDPGTANCEQPWPTEDYTWDAAVWQECNRTGGGITQDLQEFWCDPAWTADPAAGAQCVPGYTEDPSRWAWCNPRYTSDPGWWSKCEEGLTYTTDSELWPECVSQWTSDPYLWPECEYTSDAANPDCSVPPPDYPTQDYTSNAIHWPECDPGFTSDPRVPECEDPTYTDDVDVPQCKPEYTTSAVIWPVCHYTTDPEVAGCKDPWPGEDYTWDAALWPECDPAGAGVTQDPNAFWCDASWTSDPDLWPACVPVFTRDPQVPECDARYTYDVDLWDECGTGLYTSNALTWPECDNYTADARIWPECSYTSDPVWWPECAENQYPTKDFTADPAIWPECVPPPEDQGDLGDAPDDTNHAGAVMTAYPAGGPPGVLAHFPTVFDSPTGLPAGPMHWRPRSDAWLGMWVTREHDADLPPDEDGPTNISPALDQPDLDERDDGVWFPVAAPHCAPSVFTYTVTITPGASMRTRFVNVWFDWLRDGDWDDSPECPDGTRAPEWAVQNQVLPPLPPGVYVFTTPTYMPWKPSGDVPPQTWMRISIAEQPAATPEDGRGPVLGYEYGETEDYYFEPSCPKPVADFSWDPPTICPATTVQFWDHSSGFPAEWFWDFGDSTGSSSAKNPSHVYGPTGVGPHVVTLEVSNICGASIVTKTLEVIDCSQQEPDYDIYIKDNGTDDGSVPSSSPWWVSPDIWVRNDGDCSQTSHQNPVPGTSTTVCVRVRNRMTTAVDNIKVNLYWTAAALGTSWPGSWTPVGGAGIAHLAGGSTAVRSVTWHVPYLAGHACLLARIDAPNDPLPWGPDTMVPVDSVPNNNNIAQRNTSIADAPEITGCGVYTTTVYGETIYFDAVNTAASNKMVDIVLTSSGFPLDSGTLVIDPGSLAGRWSSLSEFTVSGGHLVLTGFPASINGVSMGPHEIARIALRVEAEIDEAFVVDITEKSGGKIVGGIRYVRDLPRCLYLPVITKDWSP